MLDVLQCWLAKALGDPHGVEHTNTNVFNLPGSQSVSEMGQTHTNNIRHTKLDKRTA